METPRQTAKRVGAAFRKNLANAYKWMRRRGYTNKKIREIWEENNPKQENS